MKLIIPKPLLDEISLLNLNKTTFDNIIDFYYHYISYSFQLKESDYMDTFIPFSSSFLKKRYSTNYFKSFINPLLKRDIISRSPYFCSGYSKNINGEKGCVSKPFSYKFKDDLLDFSNLTIIDFNPRSKLKSNKNFTKKKSIKYVVDDLRKLGFDIDKMLSAIGKLYVNALLIANSKSSNNDVIEIKRGNGSIFRMQKYVALLRAKVKQVDLLEYKGNYYIMKLEDFVKYKNLQLKIYNCFAVTKILNKEFFGRRNPTNSRVDSNLTNLSKIFFDQKCISLDNEPLSEIDLKNSQPTLLSFLLRYPDRVQNFNRLKGIKIPSIEKTQDVMDFIELSENGVLYDFISANIGITRDLSKKNFLKIMFSKSGWKSTIKYKIRELFPTIIDWMDKFKQDVGAHSILAITLQRLEAEIFIDQIYKELRKERYIVYTKHDCILCKSSEYEEIKEIVTRELSSIGLKFKLS